MKHRCELGFRLHRAFTHPSLSRVPLCVSWAFLVKDSCRLLCTLVSYFMNKNIQIYLCCPSMYDCRLSLVQQLPVLAIRSVC